MAAAQYHTTVVHFSVVDPGGSICLDAVVSVGAGRWGAGRYRPGLHRNFYHTGCSGAATGGEHWQWHDVICAGVCEWCGVWPLSAVVNYSCTDPRYATNPHTG